jgi:hypothetical protein
VLLLTKHVSSAAIDALIDQLKAIKAAKIRLEKLLDKDVPASALKSKGRRGPGRPPKSGRGRPGRPPKHGAALEAPRPGTLRAQIHAYLKDKGATKTNDMVKALTAKLGKKAGPSLRVRINQVLINKRDPFIKKLGRGHYAYKG